MVGLRVAVVSWVDVILVVVSLVRWKDQLVQLWFHLKLEVQGRYCRARLYQEKMKLVVLLKQVSQTLGCTRHALHFRSLLRDFSSCKSLSLLDGSRSIEPFHLLRQVLHHVIGMQQKQLRQHSNYQSSAALASVRLANFERQKQLLLCCAQCFVEIRPSSLVRPAIVHRLLYPPVMQICSRMVPELSALLVVVVVVVAAVVGQVALACLQRGVQQQQEQQEEAVIL